MCPRIVYRAKPLVCFAVTGSNRRRGDCFQLLWNTKEVCLHSSIDQYENYSIRLQYAHTVQHMYCVPNVEGTYVRHNPHFLPLPTVIMLIFEPRTPITRPIRLLGTLMVMLGEKHCTDVHIQTYVHV